MKLALRGYRAVIAESHARLALLGVAAFACTFQSAAHAQPTYQMIRAVEGVNPTALIEGKDGLLYGTVDTAGMNRAASRKQITIS